MPLRKLGTQIPHCVAMAIYGTFHTQMRRGLLNTDMLRINHIPDIHRPCTACPAFVAIFFRFTRFRADTAIVRPHWQTHAADTFPAGNARFAKLTLRNDPRRFVVFHALTVHADFLFRAVEPRHTLALATVFAVRAAARRHR